MFWPLRGAQQARRGRDGFGRYAQIVQEIDEWSVTGSENSQSDSMLESVGGEIEEDALGTAKLGSGGDRGDPSRRITLRQVADRPLPSCARFPPTGTGAPAEAPSCEAATASDRCRRSF